MRLLTEVAGLPVHVNEEVETLSYDCDEVLCAEQRAIPLYEIIPSLLNKSLRYPERVYSQHCKVALRSDTSLWPSQLTYDLILLPAGLLGIEYTKTHIFHINTAYADIACVIQVLEGQISILMQRNKLKNDPFEINTEVEAALVVDLGVGDTVAIPAGYYYTFVNVGETVAVFARLLGQEHQIDYQTLRRENGLAYYLISKNARREIVSNPRYRHSVEVEFVSAAEVNTKHGYIRSADPLYMQVIADGAYFAKALTR